MNEANEQTAISVLPQALQTEHVMALLQMALWEDLTPNASRPEDTARQDVTSFATLPQGEHIEGEIFCREAGVVAGLQVATAVFKLVDPALKVRFHRRDGDPVVPNDLFMSISGSGRSMLLAERTALNFLGRMSGIASLTARFVAEIAGTRARMLDTRKTAPGFRLLDKYAVRMGGGVNHRMGLYDMALIKDNHVDGAGGVAEAVTRVRDAYGDSLQIEVEVRNLHELAAALALPVDRILLDNMSLEDMRQAVQLADGRIPLEASGNVTLDTVRSIAETGVDYISSGALTHSVRVFDVSLRLAEKKRRD